MKTSPLVTLLIWLGFMSAASLAAADERISALFLGDNGHHRPLERARQLVPVLKPRGIDIEYTDRVEDLNADKLASYDCLIVYANIGKITRAQEKALLDFVEGGKGFVPLHCASYCFLNSPKYIALVGAQFKR
ncbi:MAG: ThuA domain-containing protein, partial [Planctomycetota bacterium]|nr:ThuA domain-containing protein [Planctomycetota bacterium]